MWMASSMDSLTYSGWVPVISTPVAGGAACPVGVEVVIGDHINAIPCLLEPVPEVQVGPEMACTSTTNSHR